MSVWLSYVSLNLRPSYITEKAAVFHVIFSFIRKLNSWSFTDKKFMQCNFFKVFYFYFFLNITIDSHSFRLQVCNSLHTFCCCTRWWKVKSVCSTVSIAVNSSLAEIPFLNFPLCDAHHPFSSLLLGDYSKVDVWYPWLFNGEKMHTNLASLLKRTVIIAGRVCNLCVLVHHRNFVSYLPP